MPGITRQITPEEVAKLKAAIPSTFGSFGKEMTLSLLWGWLMLVVIYSVLWAVVAWLGRVFFDTDFGWHSQWSNAILSIGVLLGGLLVAYEIFRQLRFQFRRGRAIRHDVAKGLVNETRMKIVDAKRFKEPEHDGLLYFLLTSDNKVFAIFDSESQDLGVQGLDPLKSSFRPCEDLVIVNAPESRFVLSSSFYGKGIELAPPLALSVPPAKWPKSNEFCNTPWKELEQQYSRLTPSSRRRYPA